MNSTNLNSTEMAEFVGIMLGDGCLHSSTNTVTICCGTIDGVYITEFIPNLIFTLFEKKVRFRKIVRQGLDCIFTSKNVCEMLETRMNFKSPKTNAHIPKQFFEKPNLLKACIRGLIDTDGGLHRHHLTSAQIKFTNKSHSLVNSLFEALVLLGYKPAQTIDHKEKNTKAIYLFNKDVMKYFKEISSNNPKNRLKFEKWLQTGVIPLNSEIGCEVRLSRAQQEKVLNKSLDSIKIVGFGKNNNKMTSLNPKVLKT